MQKIPIALCGLGTVGSAVFNLLKQSSKQTASRYGIKFDLVQVGLRRPKPPKSIKSGLGGLGKTERVKNISKLAEDPRSKFIIELIGGVDAAYDLTMSAFKHKKSVITANKALIAEKGNQLFAAAAKEGVSYYFEGAVAGGIPIIKVVKQGLAANKIKRIAGIINGTSNYILTQMSEAGADFADVLKEVQELGYAEADPTFDIDGTDAAHKLTILASLAFDIAFSYKHIHKEGIANINIEDIKWADELGYAVKHLAIAESLADGKLSLRVHPTLVHKDETIASVGGVLNGVVIDSHPLGRSFYSGAGAGGGATASAVVADLLEAVVNPEVIVAEKYNTKQKFASISESSSEYFLRMNVKDEAGVLAHITEELSSKKISIEGLTQKESQSGEITPLVIITHTAKDKDIDAVIARIRKLPQVKGGVVKLRIFPRADS